MCGCRCKKLGNPAEVAKEIVEQDDIPIYAIGIKIKRENGLAPVHLLHDIAAGNTALTKNVDNFYVLKSVVDEIANMVCDEDTHGPPPTPPPANPTTTTTTTTSPTTTSKKVCSKPVDLVFVRCSLFNNNLHLECQWFSRVLA
jgi:hypothetical protein